MAILQTAAALIRRHVKMSLLNGRYKLRWQITKFIAFKIKGDRFQWLRLTDFS